MARSEHISNQHRICGGAAAISARLSSSVAVTLRGFGLAILRMSGASSGAPWWLWRYVKMRLAAPARAWRVAWLVRAAM